MSVGSNEGSKVVGQSLTETISPEAWLIFFLVILAIVLIWGIFYLIVKSGELMEAKRKYYLKLVVDELRGRGNGK